MKFLLGVILYGLFGHILSTLGLTLSDMKFWLLLGILLTVDIISGIK